MPCDSSHRPAYLRTRQVTSTRCKYPIPLQEYRRSSYARCSRRSLQRNAVLPTVWSGSPRSFEIRGLSPIQRVTIGAIRERRGRLRVQALCAAYCGNRRPLRSFWGPAALQESRYLAVDVSRTCPPGAANTVQAGRGTCAPCPCFRGGAPKHVLCPRPPNSAAHSSGQQPCSCARCRCL